MDSWMFVSFFPRPRLLFPAAILWSLLTIMFWFNYGEDLGHVIGFQQLGTPSFPILDVSLFWSQPFIWFYIYYIVAVLAFYFSWAFLFPHPSQGWSILGTSVIILMTYLNIVVLATIVSWAGPYFDLVQKALSTHGEVRETDLYLKILDFSGVATVSIALDVLSSFLVSHYIFRWRAAMNNYYMYHWPALRLVEGAAQRIQEDTMRFSSILEGLGVQFIKAIMSLIVFLPLLLKLGEQVTELPIIGHVPHALVWAALIWALFGTGFLALIGVKLPGMEFNNQRAEAAYRKELVFGENATERADPATIRELFANVRRNYYRIYFHYFYFNIARSLYMQADAMFSMALLIPSIVAGILTLGLVTQINSALDNVRSSFQYLSTSWTTVIEFMSIYKRLNGFEERIIS
jgi:peptide/bleomycin uptake transporter